MMSECVWHEHRKQIGGRVVGNKLFISNQITLEIDARAATKPVPTANVQHDFPEAFQQYRELTNTLTLSA